MLILLPNYKILKSNPTVWILAIYLVEYFSGSNQRCGGDKMVQSGFEMLQLAPGTFQLKATAGQCWLKQDREWPGNLKTTVSIE